MARYYRRRVRYCPDNCKLMLHKRIIWEENTAPLNPTSPWLPREGTILDISQDRSAFWVSDNATGVHRWVDPSFDIHRAIAIKIERKQDVTSPI